MAAYYNEIDLYCAEWLKALMADGIIPDGDVDTRPIQEVSPADVAGYTQVHFFAGLGGWPYAARLAGWPDHWPIWTGSCPCQPFSAAGRRRGFRDRRHLWPHMFRLIRGGRPFVVVGEQVAGKAGYAWFDRVFADLAKEDYPARAVDIPACSVNTPHIRNRLYWLAVTERAGAWGWRDAGPVEHSAADAERASDQPLRRSGTGGGLDDAECFGRAARRSWDHVAHERIFAAAAGCNDDRGLSDADGERLPFPEQRGIATAAECGIEAGPAAPERYSGLAARLGHAARERWREGQPAPEFHRGGHAAGGASGAARGFWDEWVLIGPDPKGKFRRIKPGVRLLAHGIPARIPKLRAFGNAIVPEQGAEVIRALMEVLRG